jgi:NH3-dependent NAD+ synthetase
MQIKIDKQLVGIITLNQNLEGLESVGLRMVCLYLEAEQRNYAVVGTTNRTEAATGFYVKWIDHEKVESGEFSRRRKSER